MNLITEANPRKKRKVLTLTASAIEFDHRSKSKEEREVLTLRA